MIFFPATCVFQCELGSYGPDCGFYCNCNNQPCDPVTGLCQCGPGFKGQHCELVGIGNKLPYLFLDWSIVWMLEVVIEKCDQFCEMIPATDCSC